MHQAVTGWLPRTCQYSNGHARDRAWGHALNRKIRKLILGQTPDDFESCCPDATPDQLNHIRNLVMQYRQLTNARKRLQDEAGRVSRKIGAARAIGDTTDELKSLMRGHSRELAALKNNLAEIEQQIDHFTGTGEQSSCNSNDDSSTRPTERYQNTHAVNDQVSVALLRDETAEWNRYASNHPAGSLYHRAEWRELIAETFGHRGYYCVARNGDGQIIGILPMIRLSSRLFGDFMVSIPYFNYGGPLGDNANIESALIDFATQLGDELGVSHIEFRDDVPRAGMPSRTEKVNMVMTLPGNEEILWDGFSSKLRSQIRRSQRERPVMNTGGMNLLDDFYAVFARNMRDLGTPVYDRNFFKAILETFPEQSYILVATLDNRPVAAGFLIGHGDKMEIPWASAIRDVNHLSINMFLYWEALKYSVNMGYRFFDFGRSTAGSGTYRFKQQWGAEPLHLYWHYWLKDTPDMPALNPSNPKYALFIRMWKLLPVPVTKWLGPMIVKYLP